MVKHVREILKEKKGEDVVILDVHEISTVTDFFLICTATSQRHSKSLAEYLRMSLRTEKLIPMHIDGLPESSWVVMDYIDFIVHIFIEETRELYALEKLWGDAEKIE
jgi:ribosome-associated protein